MSWEIKSAKDCFSEHASEWDKLNNELYCGHPLLDSRFVGTLIKHFGSQKTPFLAIEYDKSAEPKSMVIMEYRGKGVWQTFFPSQAPIGPCLLSDESSLNGLARRLFPRALCIDLLSEDEEYSFKPYPKASFIFRQICATTMNVEIKQDFDKYWEERPRKLRKNIKRYLSKAIKDIGNAELRVVEDPKQISGALERYGVIESKGWKGKFGTAISVKNQQGNFYNDLLCQFARSKHAAIYEFYLGEHLVSSRISITADQMLVMLKTTFDENYARYAPGRLQMHFVLRKIFEEKRVNIIEFYTNANKDQLQWKSTSRPLYHLTWYRFPILRKMASIKRILKKNE